MRTFTAAFGWMTMMAALWAQWLWSPQSMLNDASTLNLQVVRQWTETINFQQARVTEIRYNSWEVVDGNLVVIPIEAYYAIPSRPAAGAVRLRRDGQQPRRPERRQRGG